MAFLLTPSFARTHAKHHHHSHSAQSHKKNVTEATAAGYSHQAAVQLARNVNSVRAAFVPHPHLSRHALRLAKRAALREVRMAKLETQHTAIASGNVVEAAYSLRGTRYAMGGTSRSGFDCSGFVRYILSTTRGVELPRTATEQYYHGQPVSQGDLKPGDLVFFKNTYKHGISHVGIYSGNGKFIHAANSHKGVREDSLSEPYYANHYAGARRVLATRFTSR